MRTRRTEQDDRPNPDYSADGESGRARRSQSEAGSNTRTKSKRSAAPPRLNRPRCRQATDLSHLPHQQGKTMPPPRGQVKAEHSRACGHRRRHGVKDWCATSAEAPSRHNEPSASMCGGIRARGRLNRRLILRRVPTVHFGIRCAEGSSTSPNTRIRISTAEASARLAPGFRSRQT